MVCLICYSMLLMRRRPVEGVRDWAVGLGGCAKRTHLDGIQASDSSISDIIAQSTLWLGLPITTLYVVYDCVAQLMSVDAITRVGASAAAKEKISMAWRCSASFVRPVVLLPCL